MSHTVYPSKYFVPALPTQYVGEFGRESNTTEAVLLRLLLQTDSSTSSSPAVMVKGPGGTGKTTALLGIGNHSQTWARFPEAVWFISLGERGKPSALVENLETVVRDVVGSSQADRIAELSKIQNVSSAVAEAIRLLNDRAVLLLIDDVWADEKSPEVGQSTVFSLVLDCIRRVQGNPGNLRLVVSTRDRNDVASLVPGRYCVAAEPFEARSTSAKSVLCSYAEGSYDEGRLGDIENSSSVVQESFRAVLEYCAGLQRALAVAGCGVRTRVEIGGVEMDEIWSSYAMELVETAELLKTSNPDHPAIYTMIESSLKHIAVRLKEDGIVLPGDVRVLFSLIGVVNKQESIPLSIVQCLWCLSQQETLQLCHRLAGVHILSLERRDGVYWISAHDLILKYCKIVLDETAGSWSFAHRITAEGLERMLLGDKGLEVARAGCAAFWKLGDASADMDTAAREYCLRNIARHQMEAGREHWQRLLHLLTDYRWVETRMQRSKGGNDLGGFIEDIRTLVVGCGIEMAENVKKGMALLSDAARMSMQYVASNPRELAHQLEGRLNAHAGRNAVVDRFLWSLDMYAKRPRLKAGMGMLKAAGGAVILRASLPEALRCVAPLPNGEDVVVGGDNGYLSMFSIRFATELYKLCGHLGSVQCVAVCAASQRIFSCGDDGTIRGFAFGTEQRTGEVILRHGRQVLSLAITADGMRVVFGDVKGLLTVCDSTRGQVMHHWLAHSAGVYSLSVRTEDGMIVSGSRDGTLGRWKSDDGQEVGTRMAVGSRKVWSVIVSRDGKRIAYAAEERVGILDADSGEILREYRLDDFAHCVVFGADDETVHFGKSYGTTAALSDDGLIVSDVKAHTRTVFGITQCREGGVLVSVSRDKTLSVQRIESFDNAPAAGPEKRYKLDKFVVLPDRKRILYSWLQGPRGLQLLNLGTTSLFAAESEQALIEASKTIGSANVWVTAIAASRDGRCAVVGTASGMVVLYDTRSWQSRHKSLRRMPGTVLSAAISNDGTFFAAGSSEGSVALFRVGDGSEVSLPSSAAVQGQALKVAFSEENSSLLAAVRNVSHGQALKVAFSEQRSSLLAALRNVSQGQGLKMVFSEENPSPPAAVRNLSQTTGMLHFWKHINPASAVEHISLPFSMISSWIQPPFPLSVIATTSHIATRHGTDNAACIYDFGSDQKSWAFPEDQDGSELLRLSDREYGAFELEGALFMEPFGRAIRYRHRSGSEVLGTLEAPICQSFRPEQWTFDDASNLFMAGGFGSNLLSAVLVRENTPPHGGEPSKEPRLPPIHRAAAAGVGITSSSTETCQYKVFISHAEPDKRDIAIPVYRRLMKKGIKTFVDKNELRPCGVAVPEMVSAMQTADIGVFILSPDFVCGKWPLRELSCFLSRRARAESMGEKPPLVLPVFYRLNVHQCRSSNLFNEEDVLQVAKRRRPFSRDRQEEMPMPKVLDLLNELTGITGIENEEGAANDAVCTGSRVENQMKKGQLIERIVEGVLEARTRRDEAFEAARASYRGGSCTVA